MGATGERRELTFALFEPPTKTLGLTILHLHVIGDKGLPALERIRKIRQAVDAPVHKSACPGKISGLQGLSDTGFLILEERSQQPGSNVGIVGQVRVLHKLLAQTDGLGKLRIVCAAGELNEAAPFEKRSVRRSLVAEVRPVIVAIEWLSPRGGV
jgi:hypothetical protein